MISIRGLKIKAILFGSLADILGTSLSGLILCFIYGVIKISQGVSAENLSKLDVQHDFLLQVSSLIIGSVCTLLGGYIAGRMAKQSEVLHGGIVGILSLVFASFFIFQNPLWFNIIGFIVTIPLAMAGGHIAKNK